MNRHRNVQLLREREIPVNRGVAWREPLILQPDLAHDLESVCREILAQFIEWDAHPRLHAFLKAVRE